MSLRIEACEERHICGFTGHRLVEGVMVRCPCREEDERERVLGMLYAPDLLDTTELTTKSSSNIVIEGPLASIRRHVGRVLLDMIKNPARSWLTMDAYRLIEIFLGEDSKMANQSVAVDTDLFILMLGFADPPNKYLPELILQVLSRRELIRRPTWVILGIPLNYVSAKYNQALQDRLTDFAKVRVK